MTLWDYLPQRHRVLPYWIASMKASVSKNDTRNVQRTPFGRLIHLTRLSALFWSLKCQTKKEMFSPMSLFCVMDALCNRPSWYASGHLHTFEAISLSYII